MTVYRCQINKIGILANKNCDPNTYKKKKRIVILIKKFIQDKHSAKQFRIKKKF